MLRPLSKNKDAKAYAKTDFKMLQMRALWLFDQQKIYLWYSKRISPTTERIKDEFFVFERLEIIWQIKKKLI